MGKWQMAQGHHHHQQQKLNKSLRNKQYDGYIITGSTRTSLRIFSATETSHI